TKARATAVIAAAISQNAGCSNADMLPFGQRRVMHRPSAARPVRDYRAAAAKGRRGLRARLPRAINAAGFWRPRGRQRRRTRGLLRLDRIVEDLDAILRGCDGFRERLLREVEVMERRSVHRSPPFPVRVRVTVLQASGLERVLRHAYELSLAELVDELR